MSNRFGVSVIGAGIGKKHVDACVALNDCFEVRYVCDLNLDRAKEAAVSAPDCKLSDDFDAVLADADVDIIDICLPPKLHVWAMEKGLKAGKHVVCEKPLARSVQEIRSIAALSQSVGRHVFPVFQYRYGAGYRRAHALKLAGLLGRPYVLSIETHWQRGSDYYSEPWRGTWEGELGGVIVSHASHAHNLATHLVGPVVEVAAFLDTRVNPIETEDCATISMRSETGALITSSITAGAAGNRSRFRAIFEHVTMTSGAAPYHVGSDGWVFEAADPGKQAEIEAVLAETPMVGERFEGLFADIYAMLHGKPDLYLPTLGEALHSTELITAIYDAARNRRVVGLPLGEDGAWIQGWPQELISPSVRSS